MNDPVFLTALIGIFGGLFLACVAALARRVFGGWSVVLGWLAFFLVAAGFMDAMEKLAAVALVAK